MIKKTLLSVGLSAGLLLMASQALAVAYVPGAQPQSPAGMQATAAVVSAQPVSFTRTAMPCPMMQQTQGSNSTLSMSNCGNMMFSSASVLGHFGGTFGAWLGLMFVLTVIMVWVVLLLLIALLWKMLKKHKHA